MWNYMCGSHYISPRQCCSRAWSYEISELYPEQKPQLGTEQAIETQSTKQQSSDWGHQARASGFGRVGRKWSLEIFFWNMFWNCRFKKPSALFVGQEGAVKGANQLRHTSIIILQKQLYLIKSQQYRVFRECIILCMFEYFCYFSVYPLSKLRKKIEEFQMEILLKRVY